MSRTKKRPVLDGFAACIDTHTWVEICDRLYRKFGSVKHAHTYLFGEPICRTTHGGRLVSVWDVTDGLRVIVGGRSIGLHMRDGLQAADVGADIRAYLRELREALSD